MHFKNMKSYFNFTELLAQFFSNENFRVIDIADIELK